MKVRFIIQSISNVRNKHIAARLIAHNPKISMNQATLLIDHLPAVIFPSIEEDEAKVLEASLRKLGCEIVMQHIAFAEVAPPRAQEPPPPETSSSADTIVTPHVDNIPRSVVFRTSSISDSPHPKSGDAFAGKTGYVNKKALLVTLILLLVIAIPLGWKLTHLNKSEYAIKHMKYDRLSEQLADNEKRLASDPKSNMLKQDIIETCKNLALIASNAAERIRLLEKANKIDGRDNTVRSMLSFTYADSAKRTPSCETAVRFFITAIGFNRLNEAAWIGLVNAYEKCGQQEKAAQTQREKDEIFKATNDDMLRLLLSYGNVIEAPYESTDTLVFSLKIFQSGRNEAVNIAFELLTRLSHIKSLHFVSASLHVQNGKVVHIISPLAHMASTQNEWRIQARISE